MLAVLAVLLFTGCEEFLNSLDNPVSPELQMSESPVTMKIGETYTRTARVRSDAIVAYSSSNEAVATVDEKGTVTAQAEGTATITASVTGGKVQYTDISFTPMSLSYEVTVEDATDPMLAMPLTLEATSAGTIEVTSPQDGMQYSKNGGAKTAVTTTAIDVVAGDKVAFYGNGTSIASYMFTMISGGTAEVKVYGNIMSLLDEEGFATATELTATTTFWRLFTNYTKLTDASGLRLPAMTLTKDCYQYMFSGCTALTTAPEKLPAESLAGAQSCYLGMFNGCSLLTTAPELPAMILGPDCYKMMFQDCYKLATAPELPATTLAYNCYQWMFTNCTALTTAYVKAAYTVVNFECDSMFDGCTAAGAKLHTTTANKASWDGVMGATKTWSTWTAVGDWND